LSPQIENSQEQIRDRGKSLKAPPIGVALLAGRMTQSQRWPDIAPD
jgi:hypothetical protein